MSSKKNKKKEKKIPRMKPVHVHPSHYDNDVAFTRENTVGQKAARRPNDDDDAGRFQAQVASSPDNR